MTATDERQMTRDFRLLAAGQALSWLGNGFQTVALAVAVVGSGGGATQLGVVLAAQVIGNLGGTLFGGVWADRLQPQQVMVASDLARVVTVACTAAMFGTGHFSVGLLSALAAATAAAGSFFAPAMTALRPLLVPPLRRQSANATLGLLQTICSVAGPALGGLVVAAFGPTVGFAVNSASFLASVATVLLIKAHAPRPARSGLFHEMFEGWTQIRQRDWLLSGVLAATVYHVANGVVMVLTLVIGVQQLGGAGAVGVIAGAEGVGGVIGTAIALRFRPARLLRAGWLALPLMSLWVLAYVTPGTLSAVVVGAVVGYAGLLFFDVAWSTALQDHVPHQYLARVASWDTMTSFVGMPLGNALAGPLSDAFGVDRVLLICAATLAIASVIPLLFSGTRTMRRPSAASVHLSS